MKHYLFISRFLIEVVCGELVAKGEMSQFGYKIIKLYTIVIFALHCISIVMFTTCCCEG